MKIEGECERPLANFFFFSSFAFSLALLSATTMTTLKLIARIYLLLPSARARAHSFLYASRLPMHVGCARARVRVVDSLRLRALPFSIAAAAAAIVAAIVVAAIVVVVARQSTTSSGDRLIDARRRDSGKRRRLMLLSLSMARAALNATQTSRCIWCAVAAAAAAASPATLAAAQAAAAAAAASAAATAAGRAAGERQAREQATSTKT